MSHVRIEDRLFGRRNGQFAVGGPAKTMTLKTWLRERNSIWLKQKFNFTLKTSFNCIVA